MQFLQHLSPESKVSVQGQTSPPVNLLTPDQAASVRILKLRSAPGFSTDNKPQVSRAALELRQ